MLALLRRMWRFTFRPESEWSAAAGRASARDIAAHVAVLAAVPAIVAGLLTTTGADMPIASLAPLATDSPFASALHGTESFTNLPVTPLAERASPSLAAMMAVLAYAGTWLSIAFVAVLLKLLLPVFSGRGTLRACMSIAGYSATPVALSSIALLYPSLVSVIALACMHSCYVAYLGLTPVLRVPRSDAGVCLAIAMLLTLLLSQVAGYGAGALLSAASR